MHEDYTSLLVIDCKTTLHEKKASNDPPNEIIRLDVALVDTDKNIITEHEIIHVKPVKNKITDYCVKCFGVTQRDVDTNGVSFSEVYRKMRIHYMLKDRQVASWTSYDTHSFNVQCKLSGLEVMLNPGNINLSRLFALMTATGESQEQALKYTETSITENSAYNVATIYCRMARGLRPLNNKQRIVQPAHSHSVN